MLLHLFVPLKVWKVTTTVKRFEECLIVAAGVTPREGTTRMGARLRKGPRFLFSEFQMAKVAKRLGEPIITNGKNPKIGIYFALQLAAMAFMLGGGYYSLKHEIHEVMTDRWTCTDDELYMLRFEVLNPEVTLPEHRTTRGGGVSEMK